MVEIEFSAAVSRHRKWKVLSTAHISGSRPTSDKQQNHGQSPGEFISLNWRIENGFLYTFLTKDFGKLYKQREGEESSWAKGDIKAHGGVADNS